jgi:asparaginyl-tRNA synthetase
MVARQKIDFLLKTEKPIENILIKGWVRTKRDSKTFSFIEINDGSCLKNIQIVADATLADYTEVKKLTTGSAVAVWGDLVPSRGGGQKWEVQASRIDTISLAPETYPLQKKRHSDEYLRTIAHLRPRTNKYGSVFRIRSEISWAVHQFFRERGFCYIHTPIITGSDCEGAGELFRVTTLDPSASPSSDKKSLFADDFFGQESNLTVSGQLSAEMLALSLGDVYTFGPTFRAENSNTSRHVAEFWMIEPEMAFCDLEGNISLGEDLIKYLISFAMDHCTEDLNLFARFVDKSLLKTLENIVNAEFGRIPYKEAVDILMKSKHSFDFPVSHGSDLQSEHERYLTETHFKKPIAIYDYPKNIKPFYMRLNDDNETVGAMDILVPRIGELIGGSQREERLDILEQRMVSAGLSKENYWWYLDSRRYGTVPHSGFGLGFERLLMLLTGISNIRDVIPFPRTPGSIDF